MSNTKQKNILDDVLYGANTDAGDTKRAETAPGMELLDGIIHRTDGGLKPEQGQDPSQEEETFAFEALELECPKKRTTIYLSPVTYDQLAASKNVIRDLLPEAATLRVSMSGVVDNALQIMLTELAEKRKDSVLFKLMLRNSK